MIYFLEDVGNYIFSLLFINDVMNLLSNFVQKITHIKIKNQCHSMEGETNWIFIECMFASYRSKTK